MNKKIVCILASILVISLACTFSPRVVPTPAPEISSNVPLTEMAAGTVNVDDSSYFTDDFTDSGSGWPTSSNNGDAAGYSSDNYRIYITSTNRDLIANPGLSFPADVAINVDEIKYGPDNNAFGVICRLQDPGNFYFFELSSTGSAVIGMLKENQKTYLSANEMQKVDGINPGITSNHIKAICQGDQLSLFANENLVAQVQDSTFSAEGDVGLIASSFENGDVEIVFRNFSVTKP